MIKVVLALATLIRYYIMMKLNLFISDFICNDYLVPLISSGLVIGGSGSGFTPPSSPGTPTLSSSRSITSSPSSDSSVFTGLTFDLARILGRFTR